MRAFRVLALLLIAPQAHAAELNDMRLWDGPDSTRVVFDLSAATTHNLFTLENPSRLVIDIAGISETGRKVATRQTGVGVVKKVRSGPRDDGSLRVVFDLAGPVQPKSFILEPNEEYGYRLMLDLQNPAQQDAQKPLELQFVEALPQSQQVLATPPPASTASAPVAPSQPAVTQAQTKPIVVAIDAGHGGEDPGARGKSGLLEKTVSLALSRKLAKLINATPGMKAVLTRDGDYYVGLRDRINTARKSNADLFISIHANAFKHRDMRGTAVYVLSPRGATNEHARWLAHKENSADMVGGIEIQDKDNELAAVLIDLSQNATMEASFDVGSRILSSMKHVNVLQKSVVQQAGFVVLKAPDIPSVLVETAFITNEQEERKLRDPDYQDKMARSMFDGVRGYFQSYRPQQQIAQSESAPEPGLVKVSTPSSIQSGEARVELSYTGASSQATTH